MKRLGSIAKGSSFVFPFCACAGIVLKHHGHVLTAIMPDIAIGIAYVCEDHSTAYRVNDAIAVSSRIWVRTDHLAAALDCSFSPRGQDPLARACLLANRASDPDPRALNRA